MSNKIYGVTGNVTVWLTRNFPRKLDQVCEACTGCRHYVVTSGTQTKTEDWKIKRQNLEFTGDYWSSGPGVPVCVFSVFFFLTDLTELGILIYVLDMTRFYTSIQPPRSHRAAMNNDKLEKLAHCALLLTETCFKVTFFCFMVTQATFSFDIIKREQVCQIYWWSRKWNSTYSIANEWVCGQFRAETCNLYWPYLTKILSTISLNYVPRTAKIQKQHVHWNF